MSQTGDLFQVCLVGRKVSDDWRLIQSLRSRCLVTLAERMEVLAQPGFFSHVQILVLDCSGNAELVQGVLSRLREELPELCVVLVDGGLSQKEIAGAFQQGIKDYFADPYDVELLLERMDSLYAQTRLKAKESG